MAGSVVWKWCVEDVVRIRRAICIDGIGGGKGCLYLQWCEEAGGMNGGGEDRFWCQQWM